jgi:chromosome partitioning protein
MLNCKQASELLKISAVRVKQLLKENAELGYEKTEINNGMIRITPKTMSSLLSLRGFSFKHKRIVIKQQKGGVGGTSLSLLAAMRLAQKGAKILYIDLDSEANATSFLAPPEFNIGHANTMLEIFKNEVPASECIVDTRFENVSMIPSKGMLRRVDKLLSDKNPKMLMDKLLKTVEKDFDVVFMDLPPTYTRLTESAYLASDLVILPYDTSSFSIEGVMLTFEDLQASIAEYEVKREIEIKVLMNKYSTTTTASKEAFSAMAKIMNDKILPFTIKASSDIVNCINNGKNLFETKANAEVRANIEELCDYIAPIQTTNHARH